MTSGLGSVSISASQLLGGTASKIDTDALIDALMKAKAVPQDNLKTALTKQQTLSDNLQEMSRRMQAITSAAMSLTDLSIDGVPTKATSSSSDVVANSTSGAIAGSATFHIDRVSAAQVSTVSAGGGDLVANFADGLDLTIGDETHHIDLASGSAKDIASAVNKAGLGIRAAVVNTDDGQVLQFTSAKTGEANKFSFGGLDGDGQPLAGFTPAVNNIIEAQDARISVGTGAGSYSISSATNTFTEAMPGVTFSVSAAAAGKDVTISVGDDVSGLADKMQALVDAINSAKSGVKTLTAKGGLFQGDSLMNSIGFDLASTISAGTIGGQSLTKFGIDMDKDGVVSFDAAAFTAAYQADPAGTQDAIADGFAASMRQVGEAASLPAIGSLSQAISSGQDRMDSLNTQIDKWSERLDSERTQMVLKYSAMQTAMAKLQSQGDWLTSMFKSITDSQKSD